MSDDASISIAPSWDSNRRQVQPDDRMTVVLRVGEQELAVSVSSVRWFYALHMGGRVAADPLHREGDGRWSQ